MITVVIVGYNSEKDLNDCLSSLFKSDYKKFKVIFVDNNSSDKSVDFIKKNYPEILLIESKANLGFAGGNNLGIKEALKEKPDYLFLLNPDTIVKDDCLSKLISNSSQKEILQPLILIYDKGKTNLINTTGNHLSFLGISYCDNYKKPASFAKKADIPTSSGAGMFIPSQIINKIGLFDQSFFMYNEDLDLSWRARSAGYNIRLVPDALIWHKYSFSKNKRKFFFIEKNRFAFLVKNFRAKTLLLILPALIVNEVFILLWSIVSGWFLLKIESYFLALWDLPKTIRNRKAISRLRKVPDSELKRYIGYELNFSEAKVPFLNIYSFFLKIYWALIYKII